METNQSPTRCLRLRGGGVVVGPDHHFDEDYPERMNHKATSSQGGREILGWE